MHIAVDISIDSDHQSGGISGDESTEIIEYLLDHGANVHAEADDGSTPMDWAGEYGAKKIVSLLNKYERETKP